MKALSLWQPWASMLIIEAKLYETRSWRAPATILPGDRIAIHAAKKWSADLAILCRSTPFKFALESNGIDPFGQPPLGVILGTMVFRFCRKTEEGRPFMSDDERAVGDWSPGRWAWRLDDPVRFAQPIHYRGAQGIFEIPTEILAAAMAGT